MDINERLSKLGDEIRELREKRTDLIHKQYQVLWQKIQEYNPIIDFVRKRGFYFTHPSNVIRLRYLNGPILMHDPERDEVLVYDAESNQVVVLSNYDGAEIKSYNLYNFVEEYGIDEAIKSLKYLDDYPENIVNSLKEECAEREASIQKYQKNDAN